MTDHAKKATSVRAQGETIPFPADPNPGTKGPYGIAKMPAEERTAYGICVKSDTLLQVVTYKARHPLASQELIAESLGLARSTVQTCLNTPYAKRLAESQPQGVELLANRLRDTQGNVVEYWARSVDRGMQELNQPSPQAAILTNARECGTTVSKVTGLLKDTIRVQEDAKSMLDYTLAHELDNDPDVSAFLAEPGGGISHPGAEQQEGNASPLPSSDPNGFSPSSEDIP